MAQFINSKKYGSCVQLYKKANGDITYYACYNDTAQLDAKGRPQKQRIKIGLKSEGITEQYVKAKCDEFVTAQRLGEIPEPIKRKKKKAVVTLQQLAHAYFENREHNAWGNTNILKNIRKDKSIFNKHLADLANQDMERLTREKVEKLKQQKLKKLAGKTVNNILTQLSAILNFALDTGKLANVIKITKLGGIDNARERYFDKEEIKLILRELNSNKPLILFVMLSLSTGGRLETIRAIKVKDINLKAGTIHLTDYKAKTSGKGKASYTGYISDQLQPLLKEAIQGKLPNDYVLQYPGGGQVGMDYVQTRLQNIFNRLFNQELETDDAKNRAVVHTLRHTFASLLAIAGTPIYTIQRLMNHADIKMTLRYAKLSPDNGKEAINKINIF